MKNEQERLARAEERIADFAARVDKGEITEQQALAELGRLPVHERQGLIKALSAALAHTNETDAPPVVDATENITIDLNAANVTVDLSRQWEILISDARVDGEEVEWGWVELLVRVVEWQQGDDVENPEKRIAAPGLLEGVKTWTRLTLDVNEARELALELQEAARFAVKEPPAQEDDEHSPD